MRRSSLAILLAALALLSRLLAPLAVEARGFDPLTDAPICTHDGGAPGPSDGDDRSGTAHAGLCALMCCHVAPTAFLPPTFEVATLRASSLISWIVATSANAAISKPASLRARGPPLS